MPPKKIKNPTAKALQAALTDATTNLVPRDSTKIMIAYRNWLDKAEESKKKSRRRPQLLRKETTSTSRTYAPPLKY